MRSSVALPQWFEDQELGLFLDLSSLRIPVEWTGEERAAMVSALLSMQSLEAGAIANPDEGRAVGHYWLRAAEHAPDAATRAMIGDTVARVQAFANAVSSGAVKSPSGQPFQDLVCVGIGGSALGPQLVVDALARPGVALTAHFLDNTDPDGLDRLFQTLRGRLDRTLVLVTSKSGSTPEPRNMWLEVAHRFRSAGLEPGTSAVAITGVDSELDREAVRENFLARFPMWDWVGGRTSVFSAVGLLPAALIGVDLPAFLAGAARMDAWTRTFSIESNPAAQLARAWFQLGRGRGDRHLVMLPYKDRLGLIARYLQQLVMESLGKSLDLGGRLVEQGLSVFGNKGSTDQHAFVQQLRDGRDDFFVGFVQVLREREEARFEVEAGVSSGDYLFGFLQGTRQALAEKGRRSFTVGLERVDALRLGALLALMERTVGLYAHLIGINAYHQPGVEAGKKAAARVLQQQRAVEACLQAARRAMACAEVVASVPGLDFLSAFSILRHLAANRRNLVAIPSNTPDGWTFEWR